MSKKVWVCEICFCRFDTKKEAELCEEKHQGRLSKGQEKWLMVHCANLDYDRKGKELYSYEYGQLRGIDSILTLMGYNRLEVRRLQPSFEEVYEEVKIDGVKCNQVKKEFEYE